MTLLACPGCGRDLYETDVWPPVSGTVVNAAAFRPANPDVPQPTSGSDTVCPFCAEPLLEAAGWIRSLWRIMPVGWTPRFTVRDG